MIAGISEERRSAGRDKGRESWTVSSISEIRKLEVERLKEAERC